MRCGAQNEVWGTERGVGHRTRCGAQNGVGHRMRCGAQDEMWGTG